MHWRGSHECFPSMLSAFLSAARCCKSSLALMVLTLVVTDMPETNRRCTSGATSMAMRTGTRIAIDVAPEVQRLFDIDGNADWHALDDLGEVASGILRWQQ